MNHFRPSPIFLLIFIAYWFSLLGDQNILLLTPPSSAAGSRGGVDGRRIVRVSFRGQSSRSRSRSGRTAARFRVGQAPQMDPLALKYVQRFYKKCSKKRPTEANKKRTVKTDRDNENDGGGFLALDDDHTEFAVNRKYINKLFETDILLTTKQAMELEKEAEDVGGSKKDRRRSKRAVAKYGSDKWDSNIVAYDFHSSIESARMRKIQQALALWERNTCLDFRRSNRARDRILFVRGGGCSSYVGKNGGVQQVSIGRGCEYTGIIAHEVAHALGYWHEQSRPDRDKFIKVNWGNVERGYEGQFSARKSDETDNYGVNYDFGSIMHYAPDAFSEDGGHTISAKFGLYDNTFGQRTELSFADIKQMNILYCKCGSTKKTQCFNDGYAMSDDCNKCICPPGFVGPHCERPDQSCSSGGLKLAKAEWQTLKIPRRKSVCPIVIKAPQGARIQLKITKMSGYKNRSPCSVSRNIEINGGSDFAATGARLCNNKPWPRIQSATHLMTVVHRGVSGSATILYRTVGSPETKTPEPSTKEKKVVPVQKKKKIRKKKKRISSWSAWTAWSKCSEPCGGCGMTKRTRKCVNRKVCGKKFQYKNIPCNPEPCTDGGRKKRRRRRKRSAASSMTAENETVKARQKRRTVLIFYKRRRRRPDQQPESTEEEEDYEEYEDSEDGDYEEYEEENGSDYCCDGYELNGDESACVRS